MPPRIIRRRLILDAAGLWLGLRVAFVFVSRAPDPLLPAPSTSLAIVAITVLGSLVNVRRLRETALLRNLGVTWPGQVMLALAVASVLELTARFGAALLLSPTVSA